MTGLTGEGIRKRAERSHDRREVLFFEISPFIEMNGRVDLPSLVASLGLCLGKSSFDHCNALDDILLVPGIGSNLRFLEKIAERVGGARKKITEHKLSVATELDFGAETITRLFGKMFQIVAKERRRCAHVILREMAVQLGPNIAIIPLGWTEIDGPCPEVRKVATFYKALGLHMPQPYLVVRGENELGVRELLFQEGAHLASVASVHRHQDVVEYREGEIRAEQMIH